MSQTEHAAADTAERCYAAGLAALDAGDLERARAALARVEALPGAGAPYGAALRGAVAAAEGDFDRALSSFREMLPRAPGPGQGTVVRDAVEALAEAGALPQALALLEEAGRGAPEAPGPLVDLAHLRLMSGYVPGARAAAERAAALQPADPATGRAISRALEAAGEPARAAEVLSPYAERLPAPGLLCEMARLYLRAGRAADAERVFRTLGRIDPDHALVARHGRAWCRIRMGDWRGALEAALEATRLDRLGLTTSFLAYAKDRLFGHVPDAAQRESELGERFAAELEAHAALHAADPAATAGREGEERG
jgi:tetratricopeptide (TPR) repeat protein